jgi:hypothetical protein
MVIVKLDFAKAFDTVEHSAIKKIYECWDFDPIWIQWMDMITSTGTSSVLVNGVPGKKFFCKRGVHQGDPLLPLLFVSVSKLLQAMINPLNLEGILHAPLNIQN